uniref:Vesicle-associated membrane protein 5 n=1 Tax=Nothobranchius korthausae TaxID=1143690 RepID=A0A1A8FLX0_9TELE
MENGKSRLQQAQEEVEEVKEIMLDNLNKADERHNKLSDLEVQAEELMEKGKVFEKSTYKVKQQKRCHNQKTKRVVIGVAVGVVVIIVALVLFFVLG